MVDIYLVRTSTGDNKPISEVIGGEINSISLEEAITKYHLNPGQTDILAKKLGNLVYIFRYPSPLNTEEVDESIDQSAGSGI